MCWAKIGKRFIYLPKVSNKKGLEEGTNPL